MNRSLRILFAGTPAFAATHLQSLIDSHHQVVAVYTQPDRPAGRGRRLEPSPVKKLAVEKELPVCQPESLKKEEAIEQIQAMAPDLMVVVAYGLLLPARVLAIPRLGCINVHASLLPRWRGAAPIQRAIAAGDTRSGVTIMQMDEGLDTGDILLSSPCAIEPDDTSASLQDRLAQLGQPALLTVLEALGNASVQPVRQEDALSTYAPRINKQEARLDWTLPASSLSCQVRAFNPWPVAWFLHDIQQKQQPVRVWQAEAMESLTETDAAVAPPGTVVKVDNTGLHVACQTGILCIKELQLPGGRAMSVQSLLNSRKNLFIPGQRLGESLPAETRCHRLQTES